MLLFSPAVRFGCVVLFLFVLLPLYVGNALFGFPGLVCVGAGLATALVWYGDSPRHTYTNIPGPPAKWLVGNLDLFVQGYHKCYEQVTQQYGRIAKVQMGIWPQIVLQDPALIRQVALEKFDSFQDRKVAFSLRENKGLLIAKGNEWHRSRRALNPAFNSIKLSAFCPTIARHCQALVERLDRVLDSKDEQQEREQEPMDVLRLFGDLTMDVIGSTSFDAEFGLQQLPLPTSTAKESATASSKAKEKDNKTEEQKDVLWAAKTVFMHSNGPMGTGGKVQMFVTVLMPFLGPLYKLLYPLLMTPEAKELVKSIRVLEKVMTEILQGRSQFSTTNSSNNNSTEEDTSTSPSAVDANFIDLVRKATDPDSGIALEKTEVRDQLNLFVLAGYETTANALAYTTMLLAQHPQVEAKLVQEIQQLAPDPNKSLTFKDLAEFTYANQVVSESLRLYPPGAMLVREANTEVTIGNPNEQQYVIPKGGWIVIPVWSLHRDEQYWDNPLQFNPDRFADSSKLTKYAHLPFGIGPRNCIGQRFALEEIKLALIAIYRNHTFRLHPRTELPLPLKAGITLSPAKGIWMTVHRRGKEDEMAAAAQ